MEHFLFLGDHFSLIFLCGKQVVTCRGQYSTSKYLQKLIEHILYVIKHSKYNLVLSGIINDHSKITVNLSLSGRQWCINTKLLPKQFDNTVKNLRVNMRNIEVINMPQYSTLFPINCLICNVCVICIQIKSPLLQLPNNLLIEYQISLDCSIQGFLYSNI